MAIGLASGIANSILDALARNVAWTQPAAFAVKLHIGDPGAAGASNAAGETTRKAVTCSAASGGSITNSADIVWTSVSTSETYSHVSFWSATVAGTFLGSDDLAVARAVIAGDTFTIAASSLTLALTPIAA
jgi:hypothetical protein